MLMTRLKTRFYVAVASSSAIACMCSFLLGSDSNRTPIKTIVGASSGFTLPSGWDSSANEIYWAAMDKLSTNALNGNILRQVVVGGNWPRNTAGGRTPCPKKFRVPAKL
jgi:hypothetical protein